MTQQYAELKLLIGGEWTPKDGREHEPVMNPATGECIGVLPQRAPGMRMSVLREPVGPVAAFAPWNFPVGNPCRKLGAALAAGCPCIMKPAEHTPASSLEVARALMDAGLPKGA